VKAKGIISNGNSKPIYYDIKIKSKSGVFRNTLKIDIKKAVASN